MIDSSLSFSSFFSSFFFLSLSFLFCFPHDCQVFFSSSSTSSAAVQHQQQHPVRWPPCRRRVYAHRRLPFHVRPTSTVICAHQPTPPGCAGPTPQTRGLYGAHAWMYSAAKHRGRGLFGIFALYTAIASFRPSSNTPPPSSCFFNKNTLKTKKGLKEKMSPPAPGLPKKSHFHF